MKTLKGLVRKLETRVSAGFVPDHDVAPDDLIDDFFISLDGRDF